MIAATPPPDVVERAAVSHARLRITGELGSRIAVVVYPRVEHGDTAPARCVLVVDYTGEQRPCRVSS